MKRIYIPVSIDDATAAEIREVLGHVHCVEIADEAVDADVIVVPSGADPGDYAPVRALAGQAAEGDVEVLVVHPSGSNGTLPDDIGDWVTLGEVPLIADDLATILCDDGELWLDPNGDALPERKTKRHCC